MEIGINIVYARKLTSSYVKFPELFYLHMLCKIFFLSNKKREIYPMPFMNRNKKFIKKRRKEILLESIVPNSGLRA